jgi:hypothetical protein
VVPRGIDGIAGVTAIETTWACVTFIAVDPVIEPEIAKMLALPAATPVASPDVAIVATAGVSEFQVTEAVRFCVLPSEYVPVAVNCCVVPLAMDGLAGVTAID